MGILSRLFGGRTEKRNSASVNDPIYWSNFFKTIFPAAAGKSVTPVSAMQTSAVYACIRVLSETIASLPAITYRKKGDSKKIAEDHYLYSLFHDSPNPRQTAFEFREMMVANTALRGNFYAYKLPGPGGTIAELWPLHPDRVSVQQPQRDVLLYVYTDEWGSYPLNADQVWHFRGLSDDGIMGLSPIDLARQSIGSTLAMDEYAGKFFSNSAIPEMVLKTPQKLNQEQKNDLRERFESRHMGSANAFKTMVLEGGLDIDKVSLTNEDSQFLESRQFQIEDIARIFRVPTILLQYSDKASTYASAEQFMLSFVVHTIRPWLVRIEQSVQKNLLTPPERKKFFLEHKVEGLLRGDVASRFSAYATARQWGWMSVNDIRRLENMDLLGEKGDVYLQPINMQEAGAPPPPQEIPQRVPNQPDEEEEPDEEMAGNGNGNNGQK